MLPPATPKSNGVTVIETFMWLRRIHKSFDNAAICLEKNIKTPVCIPHCGKCCEVNTPLWTTIEAIHAISVLTGRTTLGKIASIAEGWMLEHDQPFSYEGMPTGFVREKLVSEWQSVSKSQCPFLSGDKSCLIHEVRPLVCRASGIVRDLSEICPRPLGKNETYAQVMTVDGTQLRDEVQKFRDHCKIQNPAWIRSGFVATTLYRAAKPDKFKELVSKNIIASAKLIGIEIDANLMWQPQVDAIRSGMSPDMVVMLDEIRRVKL